MTLERRFRSILHFQLSVEDDTARERKRVDRKVWKPNDLTVRIGNYVKCEEI